MTVFINRNERPECDRCGYEWSAALGDDEIPERCECEEVEREPDWFVVSFYLVDKAYGGPEEGGWWYEYGIPADGFGKYARIFTSRVEAEAYRAELEILLPGMNQGRPPISSVRSIGQYAVVIDEGEYPAPYPKYGPRYE